MSEPSATTTAPEIRCAVSYVEHRLRPCIATKFTDSENSTIQQRPTGLNFTQRRRSEMKDIPTVPIPMDGMTGTDVFWSTVSKAVGKAVSAHETCTQSLNKCRSQVLELSKSAEADDKNPLTNKEEDDNSGESMSESDDDPDDGPAAKAQAGLAQAQAELAEVQVESSNIKSYIKGLRAFIEETTDAHMKKYEAWSISDDELTKADEPTKTTSMGTKSCLRSSKTRLKASRVKRHKAASQIWSDALLLKLGNSDTDEDEQRWKRIQSSLQDFRSRVNFLLPTETPLDEQKSCPSEKDEQCAVRGGLTFGSDMTTLRNMTSEIRNTLNSADPFMPTLYNFADLEKRLNGLLRELEQSTSAQTADEPTETSDLEAGSDNPSLESKTTETFRQAALDFVRQVKDVSVCNAIWDSATEALEKAEYGSL